MMEMSTACGIQLQGIICLKQMLFKKRIDKEAAAFGAELGE